MDYSVMIIRPVCMYMCIDQCAFLLRVYLKPSNSVQTWIVATFSSLNAGEVDSRGTYTVISIAKLLNILTTELCEGVEDFVLQCQTYEGGFGGEPFNEAHGGYNFCALATLVILRAAERCDLKAQEHWLLHRQMKLEGGFQVRALLPPITPIFSVIISVLY